MKAESRCHPKTPSIQHGKAAFVFPSSDNSVLIKLKAAERDEENPHRQLSLGPNNIGKLISVRKLSDGKEDQGGGFLRMPTKEKSCPTQLHGLSNGAAINDTPMRVVS